MTNNILILKNQIFACYSFCLFLPYKYQNGQLACREFIT